MESKVHYINRRYFESLKEDPYAIWQYLDCIEKIAYHQFQDSPLIMEELFCDDINICLIENANALKLGRNNLKSIEDYFEVEFKRNLNRPEEYIKSMIDEGLIVGINTYFYDIPNFTWYKKERYKESIHICMIVGYDGNGFWLTDVPELMKTEYLRSSHITTISYNDMNQYFMKQCNVLTFKEKANHPLKQESLDELISKILQVYAAQPYSQNGDTIFKGRAAYERLTHLIKMEDPRLLEMDFCHGDFLSFIISGRHDILKRNIIKQHGENSATVDVLKLLTICQNKWKMLACKILRENIKNGIYTPRETDINTIYEVENELVAHMEILIKMKY